MAKNTISNNDIEQELVSIVRREVDSWEDSTVFVTEKVAFQIRNLIRTLRKNYWGVFDSPVDPQTGRKKIWTHLTKYMVESVVKNIDLDTKDINFRAKNPSAISKTMVLRNAVKDELDRMYFGETLDMLLRTKSIDGTGILKTWEEKGHVKTRIVDRLNFYIDPVAYSIQEAESCIERHVTCMEDFMEMDFLNKEKVVGNADVGSIDGQRLQNTTYRGETKFVELFERYGYVPKYCFTGNKKDDSPVEAKLICSRDNGTWHVQQLEKWEGHKPYEEDWYTRVANRWDGEGVAEKVMWEQLYINIVRNIRINRAYTSQLGLFKMRRGSGITPQMLTKLSANGIIPVNNMDDIQQLVMQEASQSSYNDESNSENWARKVTSAFEAVTGESMPASTTATTSAMMQQGASSQFVLIKEGTGMFLQRWIKRHVLPIVVKNLKIGDIIRCSNDYSNYDEVVRTAAENRVIRRLEEGGVEVPPLEELNAMIDKEAQQIKMNGKDLFVELEEDIKEEDYDVQVYITNEDIDKSVMVNNLLQALPLAPEYRDQIIKQVFNLFGLDFNPIQKAPVATNMVEGMQGTAESPQATMQSQLTEATTGQATVA